MRKGKTIFFAKKIAGWENVCNFAATNLTTRAEKQRTRVRLFLYICLFAEKVDKKAVAEDFGLPQHEFLISWMESLTSLRNFCAHHSRIWNRRYALKPQMPKTLAGRKWLTNFSFPPDKIYPQLCCIAYLLNAIDTQNTFATEFKALLAKYPTVDAIAMGFPNGWQQELLWM